MNERKQAAPPVSTEAGEQPSAFDRMMAEIRAMSSARYVPRSSHFKNDWAHSGSTDRQPADGGQLRRIATARYHKRRRAAKGYPA